MGFYILLIANLFLLVQAYNGSSQRSPEGRLLHDVFDHDGHYHDTPGRPCHNSSQPVLYYIGLEIVQLLELSMTEQTVCITGYLRQHWNNELISWLPEDYGNITQISVEPGDIWTPETVLYNSVDNPSSGERFSDWISHNIRTKINVSANGDCVWLSPIAFESSCMFDVLNFPYDTHRCEVVFGPWSGMAFTISLPDEQPTFTSNYMEHGEWKMVTVSQEYKETFYGCCEEPFSTVVVTMELSRKHLYYEFNYLLPLLFLISVMLTAHWMPPGSGERIALSVTVMLAIIIMIHLAIAKTLPVQIAAITVFSGVLLLEMICSIIGNCFVLFLYHRPVNGVVFIPHLLERIFVPKAFWKSTLETESSNPHFYEPCDCNDPAMELEMRNERPEANLPSIKKQIFCSNSNADKKILEELESINDATYNKVIQTKLEVRSIYVTKIVDRFLFWALLLVGVVAFLVIRFAYWNQNMK